jgi:hypothetical protein
MSGSTHSAGRRRFGSLLTAGAIGALLLAGATACASSTTTAASSDSSSVPVSTGSSPAASSTASGKASASASSAASATTSSSATAGAGSTTSSNPVLPGTGGVVVSPQAQVPTTPSDGKLTAFTSAAHSSDGRTLYLGIESQGGACGQYDVVLQQSGSVVDVGLVHLPSGSRICPMYVAHMLVEAQLSAPLDGRRVVDLANGQTVASPQVA